jgi:hypothetical protein
VAAGDTVLKFVGMLVLSANCPELQSHHGAGHVIQARGILKTPGQAAILLAMLEYWKSHAPWRQWSVQEIDAAIVFVLTMTNSREGMS